MWNTALQSREPSVAAAELAGQIEDLLHQVWECERWWSLEDRIDLAVSIANTGRGVSDAPPLRKGRRPCRA